MTNGSPLEYALAGLLKQKPQSGYDLRKIFATTPMRHFSDSPGSIYPALRRLRSRKWVSAAAQDDNARKRQVFRLTRAGDRALIEWLRQPITRSDVVWRMDELLLRFAFLDGNVRRTQSQKFLLEFEREVENYTHELREYFANFGPGIRSSTGALAFSNGIEGYEAHLAWARRARKKLSEA